MNDLHWLLAQAAPAGQETSFLNMVFLFGPLLVIWYFLLIRPQQKQAQAKDEMLKALKKGDAIIFAKGIHGNIKEVRNDVLVVEIAEKVRVRVERESVIGLRTHTTAKAS